MLQTSTGASISDLISFTVDDIFWGELFLSPEGFLYWVMKWKRKEMMKMKKMMVSIKEMGGGRD